MAIITWEVALIAVAVGLVYLVVKYPNRFIGTSPNTSGLPGEETALPLIGGTLDIGNEEFRTRNFHFQLRKQRGAGKGGDKQAWPKTITVPHFGRLVFINHPVYLQHVQKDNFNNYPKGELFGTQFRDLLGHGIFAADGELWTKQRKLASKIFSVKNFKNHVQESLHGELEVLEELLKGVVKTGEALDLSNVFFRFTLASFGVIAFNQDLETLPRHPADLHRKIPFAEAFDFAQLVIDDRFKVPLWQYWQPWTARGRQMVKSVKIIDDYAYGVIDDRIAKRARLSDNEKADEAAKAEASGKARDLLDLYLDQGGLDRQTLKDVVLNMIIAGRDTTAQALSWLFWELSAHPEVKARCLEEIEKTLGPSGRWMTYDDISEMPYLQATFNEALRLHPPVAKNVKHAAEDDWLPARPADGVPAIKIHKGDNVAWSDWVMARLPELWGEDCAEFKPERFIGEDGKFQRISPYKMHVFNAGPRLCLGETLATFEGMAATAAILSKFNVAMLPGYETEPHYANSVTHPLETPYFVHLTTRNA